MPDLKTATLAEFLEAAGWKREGKAVAAFYDLWLDPLDPKGPRGKPWFASAAVHEEFRRREKARPAEASTPPAAPASPPAVEDDDMDKIMQVRGKCSDCPHPNHVYGCGYGECRCKCRPVEDDDPQLS